MPTFNQLVRKGRQTSVKKSTAPALQKGFNSLHKKAINNASRINSASSSASVKKDFSVSPYRGKTSISMSLTAT